jgi:hypothetical protein
MFAFLYFIFIKIRIFLFLFCKSIYKKDLNLLISIIPYLHLIIKPQIDESNPTIVLIKYENKETTRFLDTYKSTNENESFPGSDVYNVSMDDIFYKPKELLEVLKKTNNYLELKWKKKILIESTPRGNIIMFYNVYKNGFSYYSDQNSIPYSLLNAVAMKYVRIFLCRDLFIDDKNIPKKTNAYVSPLIEIYKGTVLGLDISSGGGGEKKSSSSSVFLKKKTPIILPKNKVNNNNYFQNLFTKNNTLQSPSQPKPLIVYNVNRFIFLGKICNFSIIEKPQKKVFIAKSILFNDLFTEQTEDLRILDNDVLTTTTTTTSSSKENMKYNDFIKRRKQSDNQEFFLVSSFPAKTEENK